jgi:tetratricopeptide (TPR) repeat protein
LRVAGDSYHLRLNLSLFWLERGDLDLAEEQAAKAVEVDAPDGGGRLAYGSILWRQAKYDEAIGQLQKYLHSHPDNPDANYYLGRIFAKTGRLEEARQSLEKAIENWPAEPTVDFFLGDMEDRRATAHQVLGEIHLRQGRPHLALTHLQLAEKSKPQLAAAQDFFVGISLGRLKRWPEAEHRFLKFLEKEPNNDACRGYLAFAYARQGKKDWADRTYADLMTRNPDWLKTSNEAAMKLITKKQWLDRKMADELALQSCEATNFKNAVALEVLAAVSASSGEFGKAREIAANALKLTIDNALRQRLQERLGLYERNQALPIE